MRIPFTNIVIGSNPKRGLSQTKSFNSNLIGSSASKRFSSKSMFSAYRDNGDIYGCIREWRENTGVAGIKLIDPVNPENEVPANLQSEFALILNYYETFRQLKSDTVRDFAVTGNAYWEVVWNESRSKVVAVAHLDPRTMKIVADEQGRVIKYIQSSAQKEIQFDPRDIIHFRLDSDPDNEVLGISPMEPIFWEALTDEQAKQTNFFFFENRATPGALFILDPELSDEAKDAIADQIEENLKGAKNSNRGMVLDGVKEVKEYNITPTAMGYISGRQYVTDKICSAFGVPKFMLGYTENTNYNNGKELMRKFYEGTIQPIEEMFTDTINRHLIPLLGWSQKVVSAFNPMTFNEQADIEARALKEFQAGTITLRQYKMKTGQKITPEDEKQSNFDAYIIAGGTSSVLLEDVGVDPLIDENNPQMVEKVLSAIKAEYDNSSLPK